MTWAKPIKLKAFGEQKNPSTANKADSFLHKTYENAVRKDAKITLRAGTTIQTLWKKVARLAKQAYP